MIRMLFAMALGAYCCFLPSSYLYGFMDANSKDVFMITELDEHKYAVVASDSDYLIAERVIINDQESEVYVDEKKVFAKENDPVFETMKFSSSPKIKKGAAP